MDVKLSNSDSDSSVKLDSWIVLNNEEVSSTDTNTNIVGDQNIDGESTSSGVFLVDETCLINNAEGVHNQINDSGKQPLEVAEEVSSPLFIELEQTTPEEGAGDQNQLLHQQGDNLNVDNQQATRRQSNDIENYIRVFEEHVLFYRPIIRRHLIELFNFLLGLTLGSFFITVCGLALMFLGQTTMLLPTDRPALNNSCSLPPVPPIAPFDILHNQSNFLNENFYKFLEEDDLINLFCTNKYKHFLHKDFLKDKKKQAQMDKDRVAKKIIRNYSCYKIDLIPKPVPNYTNIKHQLDEKSRQYDHLKKDFEMKEKVHKKCVDSLMQEITGLNNEIRCIQKQKWKKAVEKFDTVMADNMFAINKKISEELYKKADEHLMDIKEKEMLVKIGNVTFNGDDARGLIKRRINTMKNEYDDIVSLIKEKQKALYDITNDITMKLKQLESKKKVLHLFQERLRNISEEAVSDKKAFEAINVPLVFNNKNQMSMSNEMLDEILKRDNTENISNICICEQEEESYESDRDVQRKKRELNHLINRKLDKISKDNRFKNRYVAKWDDKTIWLSRKLNDKEHEKLNNFIPKCNPSKGWIRNKFSH